MITNFESVIFDTKQFHPNGTKLGEGSYAEVYVVVNDDNKLFAAKTYKKCLKESRSQMLFLRESFILIDLNHPGIVKFYGINFHSFDSDDLYMPTILTEYVPNKSLSELLKKERAKRLPPGIKWDSTQKYIFLIGIADAMRYIHQHCVVHRDLKPSNILIDANSYPKICDFGQSRYFSEKGAKALEASGDFGTPLYTAPELIKNELYGPKVDVYSFAIIAYEIVSKKEPFSELSNKNTYNVCTQVENGKRPKFPEDVPEKIKELIIKCWDQNPNNRPSFQDIFDLLSTDFSYFGEKLNEGEINKYLDYLKSENEKNLKEKTNTYLNKISERETNYCRIIKSLVSSSNNLDEAKIDGI